MNHAPSLPQTRTPRSLWALLLLCPVTPGCAFLRATQPVDLPPPIVRTTEGGVRFHDLVLGRSERAAEWGSTVGVHYIGRFEDGTQFDSSYERGKPMRIEIGAQQVVRGWEEGLVGMRRGGRRLLTIPPELGYGDEGRGDIIPPGATLELEVELMWIGLDE